jgi:type II secretory pathway pseudopilin PulG
MGGRRQSGVTYLAILFAVAISSIAVNAAVALWSVERQREKEEQLLFIGHQFRAAIGRYYESTPGGNRHYPQRLQDLLADPRFPYPVRHLRQIYLDPVSRTRDWTLVTSAAGEIMGVCSRSAARPLKQVNFRDRDAKFAGKQHYSEWKFIYDQGYVKNMPAIFQDVP